jgi:hypothetical protein
MTKNLHSYAQSHPVRMVVLVQLVSRLSASVSHAPSVAGDDWLGMRAEVARRQHDQQCRMRVSAHM